MSESIAFQGEVLLLGWRETHNGGAQVNFLLSDPSELDAFRRMTVAKGKIAGQRLACVLVEIDDIPHPRTADSSHASEEGIKDPGNGAGESRTNGNELARKLHVDGYFRNPKFWLAMHDSGIYTAQDHFKWLSSSPCYVSADDIKCFGDEVVHHCNAAHTTDGGKRQPEAPQKPLHYWGLKLCHAHHQWAHSSTGATREDKTAMLELAVALTAEQMKIHAKKAMVIDSLRDLTPELLKQFEERIGL